MDTRICKTLVQSYLNIRESPTDSRFTTISDCLRYYADSRPGQDAFVFVSADGRRETVTWKILYEKSVSMARGLIQLGIKRNDVVAVNVRTCPEWLYVNFGIILAGAIAANISFTYTDGSDIVVMMKKLETCSTIILDAGVDEHHWNIFRKILDDQIIDGTVESNLIPSLRHLILLQRPSGTAQNLPTVEDIIAAGIPSRIELPTLKEEDTIGLFQTSGSTGVPKLVAHTHTSILECSKGLAKIDPFFGSTEIVTYNDRAFNWIGGWPFNIESGQTRVARSGMSKDPEDLVEFVLAVIKAERCDCIVALPPLLHAMMARKAGSGNDWQLQCVLSGGQPLTQDIVECIGSLCKRFMCGYISTELGATSGQVVDDPNKFEEFSCGRLISGRELKIVDDNGDIVPAGKSGEIVVRSPGLFKGYWNDKDKTDLVLTADGWYKTDDVGHLSKSGALFVEGRKSDVIISGGMKVGPAILETVIRTCPNVRAVMVVTVPHPVLYQEVCACVIPVAGRDVKEEDLRRHCDAVHNDKPGLFTVIPKHYLIMDAFPETYTGKVSRRELAAIAEKLVKD